MKVGMIFFFAEKNKLLFNCQEERLSVGIIGEGFQNKLSINFEYPDQFRKCYRTNASRRTLEQAYILNNIETYLQAYFYFCEFLAPPKKLSRSYKSTLLLTMLDT